VVHKLTVAAKILDHSYDTYPKRFINLIRKCHVACGVLRQVLVRSVLDAHAVEVSLENVEFRSHSPNIIGRRRC